MAIDGSRQRPFDLGELVFAQMQRGSVPVPEEVGLERLVRWVLAEMVLGLVGEGSRE